MERNELKRLVGGDIAGFGKDAKQAALGGDGHRLNIRSPHVAGAGAAQRPTQSASRLGLQLDDPAGACFAGLVEDADLVAPKYAIARWMVTGRVLGEKPQAELRCCKGEILQLGARLSGRPSIGPANDRLRAGIQCFDLDACLATRVVVAEPRDRHGRMRLLERATLDEAIGRFPPASLLEGYALQPVQTL